MTGRWIMVAGAPRSGTTFVGKVLSAPFRVDYVHEPFNPACGIPAVTRRYVYARPGGAEAKRLRPHIADLLAFRASLRTGYFRNDTPARRLAKRLVGSRGPVHYRLAKLNPFSRAAILKDPVGCLLAELLADEFGVEPIVLVRHPVAFVASVQRLGWTWELDTGHFSAQSELIEDYFEDQRELFRHDWRDPLDRAAICWRILNQALLAQAARHPEWPVLRHEDVSARPLEHFHRLYARYGLPWSRGIEQTIGRLTSASNPTEAKSGSVQNFRRNSGDLLSHGIRRFTAQQRARIYELTREVAEPLYPISSFALEGEQGDKPQPGLELRHAS
jgi:hypothetical protein